MGSPQTEERDNRVSVASRITSPGSVCGKRSLGEVNFMDFWIETKTLYVVTDPNLNASQLDQFAYRRVIGWGRVVKTLEFFPMVTDELGGLEPVRSNEAIAVIDFLPSGCIPWESSGKLICSGADAFFKLLEAQRSDP